MCQIKRYHLAQNIRMLGFMIRTIAMLGCASMLVACSTIDQPIAQLPLVDVSTQQDAIIPSSVQAILEQSPSNSNTGNGDQSVTASPLFYSARGNYCRFLTRSSGRTLFCKAKNGNWFEVPSILSDLQSVERGDSE